MSSGIAQLGINSEQNSLNTPQSSLDEARNVTPQPVMTFDESKVFAAYANFARVTGTPEEVIIDVGLNNQPFGTPTDPVKINQRVVLSFYTAKRLLIALHTTLERFEQTFGVVETDIQKRINSGAGRLR